ncbi:serine hydrolase domain-containing protein [Sinosporangium siamense]|uniref:D-alanyl-D-alanine carboxypeptidase n=1 Tax=Sinosporangium siamense TaxID=1367973 RepID=A0A919VBG5_9ACTN|nr:serine hydrolase domain-containing protein [Sinosporangium siamense]GII97383.1 D-alanyl-D-alanine carboxypeptidase [Sinosporangium siamense]
MKWKTAGTAGTVLAAAAVLTTAAPAVAAPDTGYGTASLQRDVDALEAVGIVGVQARVSVKGERDLVAVSGRASVRSQRPVPKNGYFRIASTSKTYVAAVVAQLADQGKLSLDDTVEKWLPGVVKGNGNDGSAITVRQILQHTAGLPDGLPYYQTVKEWREHRFDRYTDKQLVERAMKLKPLFKPGEGWMYSNAGYNLAGMLIEKVTGNPWQKEVERRITRPLGLSRTLWGGDWTHMPQPHARAYRQFTDGLEDVTSHGDGDASGALISTTSEVNRFFRALFGGKVLSAEALAEMKKTVPTPIFEKYMPGARYGLGISSRPLPCGGTYWGHGGNDLGYSTKQAVTEDGSRAVTVSMSSQSTDEATARRVQNTVDKLIESALCDK